jgi:hypothetical protein
MSITHQIDADANHPAAIQQELLWLTQTSPLWCSGTRWLSERLAKLSDNALIEASHTLADDWAWHGPPKRLGRRFEQLLAQLFEQLPDLRLLSHAFAVQDGSRTLGEIDFLVDEQGAVHHLEVAIKFYAGIGSHSERTQARYWVGPSCQDRLDLKIQHLCEHQLILPSTDDGQRALQNANLPQPVQSTGFIFGHLLDPWNQAMARPHDIASVRHAYWAPYGEFQAAFRALARPFGGAYGWLPIPRARWLAMCHQGECIVRTPTHIERPEQADCYVLIPRDGGGTERVRLYIMPDTFEYAAYDAIETAPA